jgi:hypothetical protein
MKPSATTKFTAAFLLAALPALLPGLGCGEDTPPTPTAGTGGGGSGGASAPARTIECDDVPLTKDEFTKLTGVAKVAGREHHCALDFGSSNFKLIVDSIAGTDALTLKGERFCKVALNLGDHVRNPIMGSMPAAYPPVPEVAITELIDFARLFTDQCAKDGGKVLAGGATSWARRAPNAMDILSRIKTATGVDATVLSGSVEGRYGYWAASRGRPGMIAIDAGSSSFQISYWPVGGTAPLPWSWELGYRQAAADHFFKKDASTAMFVQSTYETAKTSFAGALTAALGSTAAPDTTKPMVTSASFVTTLKADIAGMKAGKEIIGLGEDGSLLLLRQGKLNPGGKWVDKATYFMRKRELFEQRKMDPNYGVITGTIELADLVEMQKIFADKAAFDALRTNQEAWELYGPKATGGPVLIEFLMTTFGIQKFVLVPQEMPDGIILEKLGLAK